MEIISIFALIVAALSIIKITIILIKPHAWLKVTRSIYHKPKVIVVISFILAAAVLYYLLMEGFTIIDIFAVMLFMMLLAVSGVALHKKEIIEVGAKLMKKGVIKQYWFYILIWLALSIWTIWAIFA
jgi:hypothetical protein